MSLIMYDQFLEINIIQLGSEPETTNIDARYNFER